MSRDKDHDGGMEYRIANIPEELWHRFKVLCVLEKVSMREKLIELVEKEVAKRKPPG